MSYLRGVVFTLGFLAAPLSAANRVVVPAEFVHDQVWVTPTLNGERLRFFTDTGGGWNAIGAQLVKRLEMPVETGGEVELVAWPAFDPRQSIPAAPAYFMGGRLAVAPNEHMHGRDGFLGGRWFADGVWAFDYPKASLDRVQGFEGDAAHPHRAPLGFQTNDAGARTTHFPSIDVVVDGETLPMLYDSGATATTTESSAPVFGVAVGTDIGTSFIEHAVFERWRAAHPEWRVIESADQKGPQQRRMIQVASVTVAGLSTGPVWFAEQPEGAFQQYMAGMMDRPTWGALGGSALKYFRVVIDYPGAAAYFEAATASP
ncbi:MAG: hypothetical protein KDJ14_02800 [Xanthomonadales bacterium]|nr:hypothetical protein [Xanthomonadales bacterium]